MFAELLTIEQKTNHAISSNKHCMHKHKNSDARNTNDGKLHPGRKRISNQSTTCDDNQDMVKEINGIGRIAQESGYEAFFRNQIVEHAQHGGNGNPCHEYLNEVRDLSYNDAWVMCIFLRVEGKG